MPGRAFLDFGRDIVDAAPFVGGRVRPPSWKTTLRLVCAAVATTAHARRPTSGSTTLLWMSRR